MNDFNPYSRKLHADPYPAYARLREEAPACFNERFGFWSTSRYDDVIEGLKDWRTYSSASGITLASFTGLKPMIILMHPPRHDEIRAAEGGTVAQICVENGQPVNTGELLFKLS